MLVFVTDKPRLERHFRRDPVLFAYCLGDLSEPWFSRCQWAGFYATSGSVVEDRHLLDCALIFHHGDSCTVQAFPLSTQVVPDLPLLTPLLPDTVFLHTTNAAVVPALQSEFELLDGPRPMHKMARLHGTPAQLLPWRDGTAVRLTSGDVEDANRLFRASDLPMVANEQSFEDSVWFGIRANGALCAIGGFHVWSKEQNVAVIGGVATGPDHRGRGCAKKIIAALLGEVTDDMLVCLNVAADNLAAQKVYHQFGFAKTHDYLEADLRRRA